jgi:hypothetical protein
MVLRMVVRFAWLGALACSCTAVPERPAGHAPLPIAFLPGDTAFVDVAVVPMSSDGVLAHHTVVIRGDRIVAIAPSARVVVPDGTTVIDGAGKWLMPGLADMHVHTWSEDDLTMFLAAGVTMIRNMWGVEQHLTWRSQIARGDRLGPTIFTAGSLIDGEPPDWPGSVVLTNPADADQLVIAQKAAGYDFLKPVSRLSREAYAALAAAGKRHGMVLAGHVPLPGGLEDVLAARQRSVEHLFGYLEALVPPGAPLPSPDDTQPWTRALLSRIDPARLPGLIRRTIAAGTWNCPTLIVYQQTPELHDVADLEGHMAWLSLIPAAARARWAHDFKIVRFTAEDSATLRKLNAQLARVLAALVAANAPILVGTDTGGPYVIPGEALHQEIELMVAAGVPRPRVLRAATADAWRYFGQPHEAGVVEVDARADLVLVASDPLSAPLPLVPDGVMVRGRWLARGELEARLAEIAKHGAPPADRWSGLPPLAAEGTVVHQARYDAALAGTVVGQERLVVGVTGGKRSIVGQLADLGTREDASYTLGPDTATVTATHHTMRLAIRGAITGGKLIVTGRDLSGRAVSLSEPVPAGAFLSGPGIGGAIALVAQLTAMKPGTRRTLVSLELGYPAIAIVSTHLDVERKPDAGGHQVFAVTATQHDAAVTSELVVDDAGFIVAQRFAPPDATIITRRAP